MAQKADLARKRGEQWIQSPLYLDDGAIDIAPERRQYLYDNAGNRLQAVEWLDTLETRNIRDVRSERTVANTALQ